MEIVRRKEDDHMKKKKETWSCQAEVCITHGDEWKMLLSEKWGSRHDRVLKRGTMPDIIVRSSDEEKKERK